MKAVIALALLFQVALIASGQLEDECWRRCFNRIPSGGQNYYNRFKELVTRTKSLHQSLGGAGLAITLDSATNSDSMYRYERNLATLLALTTNVDGVFNPLCLSRYYSGGASYYGSWQCQKNRCAAANILGGSTFNSRSSSSSSRSVTSGQYLAEYCMTRTSCSSRFNADKKKRMTVVIANNVFRTPYTYSGLQGEKVVIGVERASSSQISSLATSGMSFDFTGTMSYSTAQYHLRSLLTCMNTACCASFPSSPVKRSAEENDGEEVGVIDNGGKPQLVEKMTRRAVEEDSEEETVVDNGGKPHLVEKN